LQTCLDKWETYVGALKAGIPVPSCWKIESRQDLQIALAEIPFPCLMKPIASHYWRKGNNWERVGARKAIPVLSKEDLIREYGDVESADGRVLIQELIPGADDQLYTAACYLDRSSNVVAAFTTQKVVQAPESFGTGCIVRTVDRPVLIDLTTRLLHAIEYTGIAEVEYKWDDSASEYKLIEINARPWDQHRLGAAIGIDLIRAAYCDLSGMAIPKLSRRNGEWKWIAEDVFLSEALRSLWHMDGNWRRLIRQSRGRKICAIWSAADPLPSLAYMPVQYLARVLASVFSRCRWFVSNWFSGKKVVEEKSIS